MTGWWFETDRFTAEFEAEQHGREATANPGRYGEQLAQWLADGLRGRSWHVKDVFCEDWGWMIEVQRSNFVFHVQCGNEDGSTIRWSVAVDARPSLWQRFFKNAETQGKTRALLANLDAEIESLLRDDGKVGWIGREQPQEPPSG